MTPAASAFANRSSAISTATTGLSPARAIVHRAWERSVSSGTAGSANTPGKASVARWAFTRSSPPSGSMRAWPDRFSNQGMAGTGRTGSGGGASP